MNGKHTPGPWHKELVQTHVELGYQKPPAHYQIIAEKTTIAATLVCELRPYGKDNDANARLIASSPELLQAIESMLPIFDAFTQDELSVTTIQEAADLLPSVRAAIAKAKGEK